MAEDHDRAGRRDAEARPLPGARGEPAQAAAAGPARAVATTGLLHHGHYRLRFAHALRKGLVPLGRVVGRRQQPVHGDDRRPAGLADSQRLVDLLQAHLHVAPDERLQARDHHPQRLCQWCHPRDVLGDVAVLQRCGLGLCNPEAQEHLLVDWAPPLPRAAVRRRGRPRLHGPRPREAGGWLHSSHHDDARHDHPLQYSDPKPHGRCLQQRVRPLGEGFGGVLAAGTCQDLLRAPSQFAEDKAEGLQRRVEVAGGQGRRRGGGLRQRRAPLLPAARLCSTSELCGGLLVCVRSGRLPGDQHGQPLVPQKRLRPGGS
mmetsp:Transcript_28820/g.89694  ORF Transcript_28820/g.89694 Transcript_28820/m.89694 type:complete len:316 (-) Transcript_28820:443-1390(-)